MTKPDTTPQRDTDPAPSASVADRVWAIVPCGGRGSRAGGLVPKQYRPLAGWPVLAHTLHALAQVPGLQGVLLALGTDDHWFAADHAGLPRGGFAQLPSVQAREAAVSGGWLHVRHCAGNSRALTVLNSLQQLAADGLAVPGDWVLVHDAARCLVSPADIVSLIGTCKADPVGGLLAIPLPDTLKHAVAGRAQTTLTRDDKWLAQTPQMFRHVDLLQAMESAARLGLERVTDESSAMEQYGYQPRLVLGSPENIKLTYPPDFALAEAILKERQS